MTKVDGATLRANYESVIARLREDDSSGLMYPTVSARLIEDVSVESTFEQYERVFTFYGDEAAGRGGQERGPSPMRYFLSGIAFCLIGWYAKGSVFTNVQLAALELGVRTFLDMRGEHGFDGVPVHPQWIALDISVTSPSATEDVVAMIDWGDARCPLGAFARRAVPVHQRVTHNGTVVRDTTPADTS